MFFWSHFWMDFERVWGGFWKAFGRDLGGLGGSWATLSWFLRFIFQQFFYYFLSPGFQVPKRGPKRGFGGVWGRFWTALGRGPDAFQVGNQFHWNCCSMELILNFKCVMSCVSKKIHALIFLVLGFFGGVFFDFWWILASLFDGFYRRLLRCETK